MAERSVAPPRHDEVVVRETTIFILSNLFEPYLREGFDAEHGVPYLWLDREGYSKPAPEDVVLRLSRTVILENRYLQLTILPGLGGRVYVCIFKPTGQNIFYHDQVLMPTHWGPLSREQNWWLVAGGMEWAFDVSRYGVHLSRPGDHHPQCWAQLRAVRREGENQLADIRGQGYGLVWELDRLTGVLFPQATEGFV
jgi:hypothetical protein